MSWGADGEYFVARNSVDESDGLVLFAASRMNPAPPISGDLVLLSITFQVLDQDTTGAYGLTGVLLLDVAGDVPARWEGVDIYPRPDLPERVYLPSLLAGVPIR
jgi:hypothetical protein